MRSGNKKRSASYRAVREKLPLHECFTRQRIMPYLIILYRKCYVNVLLMAEKLIFVIFIYKYTPFILKVR